MGLFSKIFGGTEDSGSEGEEPEATEIEQVQVAAPKPPRPPVAAPRPEAPAVSPKPKAPEGVTYVPPQPPPARRRPQVRRGAPPPLSSSARREEATPDNGAPVRKPVPSARPAAPPLNFKEAPPPTATATVSASANGAAKLRPRQMTLSGGARAPETSARKMEPLPRAVVPPGRPSPMPAPLKLNLDEDETNEDDVDSAFERLAAKPGIPSSPGRLKEDRIALEENAQLFREMAVVHARPLREFMLELVVGSTTKQWLDIARPSLTNLRRAADNMDQREVVRALREYEEAFDVASSAFGFSVAGDERQRVLDQYRVLERVLPCAFELKGERDRREPLVVHHLLLQIPGVQKVVMDKLYGAGLTSLEGLCKASVDDLMAIGNMDRQVAESISRRFQSYWRDRTEKPLDKTQDQVKERLKVLVEKLDRAHADFQRAEAEEDKALKRRARGERRVHALEINVLLAQLGEVDLVTELERSPTEQRIQRMRTYVESSSQGAHV